MAALRQNRIIDLRSWFERALARSSRKSDTSLLIGDKYVMTKAEQKALEARAKELGITVETYLHCLARGDFIDHSEPDDDRDDYAEGE